MKLNNVVIEAEYMDIILSLIGEPYYVSSVTKIIFMSFCIRHEKNMKSYRTRKEDFVDVFFRNISFKLATQYKDISKIVHVIDMLNKTNKIRVDGDNIIVQEDISHTSENEFLMLCLTRNPNPIKEINKLDATAMIEEVIRYV